MSKLFKTMNTVQFPDWADEANLVKKYASQITVEDWQRISVADVDDDRLVEELDIIEKCAASKQPYFYSAGWNKEAAASIREYASVCGCDIVCVNTEDKEVKAYAAINSKPVEKIASATPAQKPVVIPFEMIDAFKLDQKGNTDFLKKADWEKVTPSATTETSDGAAGGIRRMKSTLEDNNVNPHLAIRPGQNSVTAPDAIGQLAGSKVEDNGTRLKRENAERAEQRAADKKLWEKEATQKAEALGYGSLSFSTVKPTEASYAHSGVRDNPVVKAENMPEKTAGEQLKDANQDRKSGIQRKKEEDRSWDNLSNQHQPMSGIGDVFAEELKARLQKK